MDRDHSSTPNPLQGNRSGVPPPKANRSIRNPASHNLIRQHSTSLIPSHHKQYILLRDKPQHPGNSTGQVQQSAAPSMPTSPNVTSIDVMESPQLHPQRSQNSLLTNNKPRPFIRKQQSAKYLFSVDDNEDEIEEDLNREYLEGYTDGLRHRLKIPPNLSNTDPKRKELENEIINNLSSATKDLKALKEIDQDAAHLSNAGNVNANSSYKNNEEHTYHDDVDTNNNNIDNYNDENDESNNLPDDDMASINSNDSFTLKERQVAINETHPFGIRIWKPAIYKKDRSVQREAENDIHCVPGTQQTRTIGLSVTIANYIYTATLGLFLFFLCYLTGTITLVFSLFCNPRTNDSIKYAKFYWSLGRYLLSPFGTLVILKSDKRYMNEDANVGSSVDEFERWRTESQGKLFFSSSNQPAKAITPETESRSYSFQHEEPSDDSSPGTNKDDEDDSNLTFYKKRFFGRGQWNIGRIVFYLQLYLFIYPISSVIVLALWLGVFTIPMAKVLTLVYSHIRRHPLALSFENEESYYQTHIAYSTNASKNDSFLILTYRSFGFHYYKYTVDGTNIFFINLIFLVIFTIVDFYLFKESFEWNSLLTNSTIIFILCLVSVIPLAYFIGQAVASISAQTSMGVGAVINAFFSTIVEVYLYCIALDQSKAKLVEGSIIGSILCGVLLLPGGSMCFGAIKRKTQRYNPASAGVSSTMLLFSIFVMLAPSLLYQIYGEYDVVCEPCLVPTNGCKKCHYYQPSITIDPLYIHYLRPFSVICAIGLFLGYCICLLFTLKTHAALIWSTPLAEKKKETPTLVETSSLSSFNTENFRKTNVKPTVKKQQSLNTLNPQISITQTENASNNVNNLNQVNNVDGGHDAPNWTRTKSTTILLVSTILYAIIAEILVDCVDDVLANYSIAPKFLGLTVFALVPNTTEFVNAFSFAMHGNVALSMEIGSAYALQVCLLQIPIVTLYSTWKFTSQYFSGEAEIGTYLPRLTDLFGIMSSYTVGTLEQTKHISSVVDAGKMFPLIFPHWDFMASLIGVYMFTYIYTEGKSNYFKGSILLTLYVVLLIGFYFALEIVNNTGFLKDGTQNLL